jgi:hypothetical protein
MGAEYIMQSIEEYYQEQIKQYRNSVYGALGIEPLNSEVEVGSSFQRDSVNSWDIIYDSENQKWVVPEKRKKKKNTVWVQEIE